MVVNILIGVIIFFLQIFFPFVNTAHRWFALWIKVPWVLFQIWSQPLPFTSTWILWASVSLPMKGKGRQWTLRGPDARWDHSQISSYTVLWRFWWPCIGWALRHSFHQPPVNSEPATGAHAEGTWGSAGGRRIQGLFSPSKVVKSGYVGPLYLSSSLGWGKLGK